MTFHFNKTTKDDLKFILDEGEGYQLEFKESVNSDLAKEMVAFANASGGRIFIGVDDNNKIKGCDISNKARSKIENMSASCDPPLHIAIEKLDEEKILVIHIPCGANRPHRCTKGFYLRNGANSQKMVTEDISAFIQAEGKVRFDQRLRLDLDWFEVLDDNRLNHFLELAGIKLRTEPERLLHNLGVGEYQKGLFYFNQTGILFFAKEPTCRLFHVNVICALFKGIGKADILDRKEFAGSIIENIEGALLFLKNHLQLRWVITNENTRRQEILEVPEAALREAVVNALCHRDYLEEGAQVTIEIFDDRVEIYNPGGLARGLKEEEFGTRSVCRNPLIAGLLLRCNYIEKLGTGIERIRRTLLKNDCPDVIARFNTQFTLEFPRSSYEVKEEDSTSKLGNRLGNNRQEILKSMRKNPKITSLQLAEIMGMSKTAVDKNIKYLKDNEFIIRVDGTRGYWQVLEKKLR